MDDGREVVIVSSGAIAVGSPGASAGNASRTLDSREAGRSRGGPDRRTRRALPAPLREAADARSAQVLLTRSGLEHRERFLNARHTLQKLLELGVVPIVNENDTVATDEIRFGDNDNLSATLVNVIGADLLVILTDVDGLHERQAHARRSRSRR